MFSAVLEIEIGMEIGNWKLEIGNGRQMFTVQRIIHVSSSAE